MLNAYDQEALVKSSHAASFLVQDLRDLMKSENPLLAEMVLDLLQQAVQLELKLKRIETLTQ
jgi:translation initiation factor 2 alpha subunit (eIF-2alpha)